MTIEKKLLDIITSVLRVNDETKQTISEDTPLYMIGMDSINCVEVVVQIEEQFDIVFEDEELMIDNLNSIRKLTNIILLKKGQEAMLS